MYICVCRYIYIYSRQDVVYIIYLNKTWNPNPAKTKSAETFLPVTSVTSVSVKQYIHHPTTIPVHHHLRPKGETASGTRCVSGARCASGVSIDRLVTMAALKDFTDADFMSFHISAWEEGIIACLDAWVVGWLDMIGWSNTISL